MPVPLLAFFFPPFFLTFSSLFASIANIFSNLTPIGEGRVELSKAASRFFKLARGDSGGLGEKVIVPGTTFAAPNIYIHLASYGWATSPLEIHKNTTKNKREADCRQQHLQGHQQNPEHFALASRQILLRAWLVRPTGVSKRSRIEEVLNADTNREVRSLRKSITDTASWVVCVNRSQGSGGFSNSLCPLFSSSMFSFSAKSITSPTLRSTPETRSCDKIPRSAQVCRWDSAQPRTG